MSTRSPLLVIGDTLLDRDVEGTVERLAPDAPVPVLDELDVRSRPGGAGLAAMLAAADGRDVTLVTALGRDEAAADIAAALGWGGVEVIDLGLSGPTPEKVRFRSSGRSLLRLDRERHAGALGAFGAAARAAVEWSGAVLVSDYGRGVAGDPDLRESLRRHAERAAVVWDPHPRGPAPVPGTWLATPNESEAARLAEVQGNGLTATARRAETLARRWAAHAVCVTRGAEGALLVRQGSVPLTAPAAAVRAGDPCGAGDRFAATAAGLIADGAEAPQAVLEAVAAASEFVAAGGAAAARLGRDGLPAEPPRKAASADHLVPPDARAADPLDVSARTRSRGGTVVATGGCFDLIHTGHVRTLEAARALGDCLIVLLNSDESVARLKGSGRPLVAEADRAAVLLALEYVDAVMVFSGDTPEAALERLRPDVFAKGGDYATADLPERAVLERHGGQVLTLPYFEGHSTTRLIEEVGTRAGR